jgi:NitT/TauT family transport system substrate-binding protein
VGALQIVSDSGLYIAAARGYFQEAGIAAEFATFRSLQEQIPLLATDKLQVGGGAIDAGLFNAVARDVPLKIVADKGSQLSPEFTAQSLVVRKDLIDSGRFQDYPDLAGLNIGVSGHNNSVELLVDIALQRGGLTLDDAQTIVLGFPDLNAAFANRSLDAAIHLEPGLSAGLSQGLFVAWKNAYDLYPQQQVAVLLYAPVFAADRDLAQRFTTAYLRGVRDYNDAFRQQKDLDAILDVLTQYTTIKDKALYRTIRVSGLNPEGYVNAAGLARDLAWYRERGSVPGDVNLDRVIDASFVTAANQTLGPYRP